VKQRVALWMQMEVLFLCFLAAIRVKLHRPLDGNIKTVSVKREGHHWYAWLGLSLQAQTKPEVRVCVA